MNLMIPFAQALLSTLRGQLDRLPVTVGDPRSESETKVSKTVRSMTQVLIGDTSSP